MVMSTTLSLTGTMVMRVQRVLRWCSADTILRLDVQPIRFSDFGEIWFPRVHCSGVVRMRRALRRNLRWNRDFKVFVANLLTQPESTGRPIIIIIITIIILVIITWWCQSRSLTRYLFAACLVFYTCENIRQVPQLSWISWFPPEAYGLGTRLVKNSFNRVIFSQEWFTIANMPLLV